MPAMMLLVMHGVYLEVLVAVAQQAEGRFMSDPA